MERFNEGYVPGDYFMECDRCGMKRRRSELRRDGFIPSLMVCAGCWDFKPTFPSPGPDRIAVPIPRPEQETAANGIGYDETTYGLNLFPDQSVLPSNDSFWSAGINSQIHVKSEYYSKKLVGVNSNVTVTGLEVGKTYRLKASTWTPDSSSILIDSIDSLIFSSLVVDKWVEDFIFFVANTDSMVLTFVGSALTNWYDDIYVQKQTVVSQILTPSQIILNTPNNDVVNDPAIPGNTIYFFAFDDDTDFNSTGLDDGVMVDTLD